MTVDLPLLPILVELGDPSADPAALEHEALVRLAEDDLDTPEAAPDWLMQMLVAVRDGTVTEWTDFEREVGRDDTNVFDFIRGLPAILPVEVENNEESWMILFPKRGLEICLSLEGSSYKVSQLGRTWDEPAG